MDAVGNFHICTYTSTILSNTHLSPYLTKPIRESEPFNLSLLMLNYMYQSNQLGQPMSCRFNSEGILSQMQQQD